MALKHPTFAKPKEEPYGKVLRRTWGDERFKKLSAPKPSGRYLWLHLLTGPDINPIPGLLTSMGIGTLADRLEWPYAATQKCWQEIADQKMAKADWPAGVIWLPRAIDHNSPANQFVVLAWRAVPLPESPLVIEGLRGIRQRLHRKKSPEFLIAFDQVFLNRFPQVRQQPPLDGLGERVDDGPADHLRQGAGDGLGDRLGDGPAHRGGDRRQDDALDGLVDRLDDGVWDDPAHQDQEQDQVRTPLTPADAGEMVSQTVSLKAPTRAERKDAENILASFRQREIEKWYDSGGTNYSAPIHQQVRDLKEKGLTLEDLYQIRKCGHTTECTDPEVCIRLIVVERRQRLTRVMAAAAQEGA